MGKSSNTTLVILAFFAIYVIWGSTYLLNKIAVLELPPFMLALFSICNGGIAYFWTGPFDGYTHYHHQKTVFEHHFGRFLISKLWERGSGVGTEICGFRFCCT